MGTPPRRDAEERSPARLGPDAEPGIPRPLPRANRRGSRMALAVLLAALAIIIVVVVLL
jgi:hypothetical protein